MKDPGSIVYETVVLYKLKADNRETCRVAASRPLGPAPPTPPTPEVLFSSVASDGAKLASISAMQSNCSRRGEQLYISDTDVVGGFCISCLTPPFHCICTFLRLFLMCWLVSERAGWPSG